MAQEEVGFSAVHGLYESLKFADAKIAVQTIVLFTVFVITIIKFLRTYKKESDRGLTFRSFYEILLPMLPYFLGVLLLPFMITNVERFIDFFIETFGSLKIGDVGQTELDEYMKKSWAESAENLKDNWYNPFALLREAEMQTKERIAFELIKIWTKYLYMLALAVYFMWLLLLEVFAPVGLMGFIFPELKAYSTTWIKNYVACKLFLVALVVANSLSLGLYDLFKQSGEYNILLHLVFLVIFRGYLYKQALTISKSII